MTNSTVGIFTVTATVWGGPVLSYQIRNYANVSLVTGPLPHADRGASYSSTIPGKDGSPPLAYSLTGGALPPGVTMASNGALSGRPTRVGTYNFTATVLDNGNIYGQRSTAMASVSITVDPPTLSLSPTTLGTASFGSPYSRQLTGSGGSSPYQYSVTAGALPIGLALSSSGLISGMPASSGAHNFTVQLRDSTLGTGAPFTGSRSYSLLVDQSATSVSLPSIAATNIGDTATFSASVSPASGTIGCA